MGNINNLKLSLDMARVLIEGKLIEDFSDNTPLLLSKRFWGSVATVILTVLGILAFWLLWAITPD